MGNSFFNSHFQAVYFIFSNFVSRISWPRLEFAIGPKEGSLNGLFYIPATTKSIEYYILIFYNPSLNSGLSYGHSFVAIFYISVACFVVLLLNSSRPFDIPGLIIFIGV